MDPAKIIETLIYVLPGFIALEVYYALVPSRRRSDLERLGISIFLSVLIYGISFVLGFDPVTNEKARRLYMPCSFLAAALIGWSLSGIRKADWFQRLINRALGLQFILRPRVWNVVFDFSRHRPEPTEPNEESKWVKVTLSDGRTYVGAPVYYSLDPNDEDKEVFLDPAWRIHNPDSPSARSQPIDSGVYVPAVAIVSIEFYR